MLDKLIGMAEGGWIVIDRTGLPRGNNHQVVAPSHLPVLQSEYWKINIKISDNQTLN